MANNTQTAVTLFSPQNHTHSLTDVSEVGTEQDVRSWFSGTIYVYHANIETTANATGVQYILQARWPTGAGVDEDWVDLIVFQTSTSAAASVSISGAESANATTIEVDADPTGAFTAGTPVHIEDGSVVADSEWGRVSHSTTGPDVVELVDGLTNAKDGADVILTGAETFVADVNLGGVSYVRLIMLHVAATGSDISFKAQMVAVTDIG